jgi:hypothetical protein
LRLTDKDTRRWNEKLLNDDELELENDVHYASFQACSWGKKPARNCDNSEPENVHCFDFKQDVSSTFAAPSPLWTLNQKTQNRRCRPEIPEAVDFRDQPNWTNMFCQKDLIGDFVSLESFPFGTLLSRQAPQSEYPLRRFLQPPTSTATSNSIQFQQERMLNCDAQHDERYPLTSNSMPLFAEESFSSGQRAHPSSATATATSSNTSPFQNQNALKEIKPSTPSTILCSSQTTGVQSATTIGVSSATSEMRHTPLRIAGECPVELPTPSRSSREKISAAVAQKHKKQKTVTRPETGSTERICKMLKSLDGHQHKVLYCFPRIYFCQMIEHYTHFCRFLKMVQGEIT